MRARKSIFIPKKAPQKQSRALEVSGQKLGMHSDEDDDSETTPQPRNDRYNLLNYNRERKQRLNEFDYTMDMT
jgi:hypothetical protein